MTDTTLVFLFRENRVLLAMKKRGHGVGKWNGPGGKLLPHETPTEAAIRETSEEIGVTPIVSMPLGHIHFHDETAGDWTCTVFRTDEWDGEPTESEEMKPQWFDITDLPYDTMWNGDDKWMPLVVEGKKFRAEMWFDEKQKNTKAEIKEL